MTRPRIGVSTCLIGQLVRYDGGHKLDRWIAGPLSEHADLVDVCPEVEIGLGTPREPIRLARVNGEIRLRGQGSGDDHTDAMTAFARTRIAELEGAGLDAYLLKAKSPSCGLERVPIWPGDERVPGARVEREGQPERDGRGLFARILTETLPALAVEDEGRLNDHGLRERFLAHAWTAARLRTLQQEGVTAARLQAFHRAHKFLLMAYAPAVYRELGALVARATDPPAASVTYGERLGAAFAQAASVGRHVNTLQHAAGMLRQQATDDERTELADLIERYRARLIPLVAVTTLLRHHARRRAGWQAADWLLEQVYLEPYPATLGTF